MSFTLLSAMLLCLPGKHYENSSCLYVVVTLISRDFPSPESQPSCQPNHAHTYIRRLSLTIFHVIFRCWLTGLPVDVTIIIMARGETLIKHWVWHRLAGWFLHEIHRGRHRSRVTLMCTCDFSLLAELFMCAPDLGHMPVVAGCYYVAWLRVLTTFFFTDRPTDRPTEERQRTSNTSSSSYSCSQVG